VQIRTPECIARKKINRGCRQGSIPILWNTYLDNLLGLLDKEESITDFAAYADDLCILISENSRRALQIKANAAVRTIYNWCQRYKMTMSPTNNGNSIWKNIKKKANNKAGDNHPSSKRTHKVSRRHFGSEINFSKHIIGESKGTTQQDPDTSK